MSVEASQMSKEEKFFGVSSPLEIPEKKSVAESPEPEMELEIIDDLPKKPPKQEAVEETDEELSDYSEKVRKRIKKLTYEQHEANRKREAAEQMREEAVRLAQQLSAKNQQYESLIQRGESALVEQFKSKASLALAQAKSQYKEAYEQGDAEKIIAAQESLLNAQTEFREAEKYEKTLQSRPKFQSKQQQVAPAQQQPPAPQPSQKAIKWAEQNPWFGPQGDRQMTALAYAVHETLIRDKGLKPDEDEYFQQIDVAMRQRFPEYFEKDEGRLEEVPQKPQRTPSAVVAPSNRSNGASPRKIQLTATQVALAKRIGLTPEQYAKQLIKESSNG